MNQHALTIDNLTFAYKKETPILNGISFTFEPGKITALLGNNGCGKTTLLRTLAGITKPNSGSISYGNLNLNKQTAIEYKRHAGYMPELLQLYPNMKTYKVLAFLAGLRNHPQNLVMETIEKVGLSNHYKKTVRSLSKGLKQRLNLAQAIIGNPKIIICDEPSNGFDYSGVRQFYTILRELANQGAVVIMTTHLFSELFDHVDNIAIMNKGNIIKSASVYDMQKPAHDYLSHIILSLDRSIETKEIEALEQPAKLLKPDLLSIKIPPHKIENLIVKLHQADIHVLNISFKQNPLSQNLEGFLT